jgi:hypothetical protein
MLGSIESINWPGLVSLVGGTLPALAAARARVSLTRDATGQSALGWLVMTGCTALAFTAPSIGGLSFRFLVTAVTIILMPLVLAPPVLRWAGPRARRGQPLILAGVLLAGGAALARLGPGRHFQVVAHPAMCVLMTVLLLVALRTQMERHGAEHGASDPMRAAWLWLIGGHLAYFLSSIFWFPLLETLALRGMQLAADAHVGLLLLHVGAMTAIARGVTLSGGAPRLVARAPSVAA